MLQKLKSQVWEFNIWQNQYNIVKFKNKIKLKKREREKLKKAISKDEMLPGEKWGR